MSARDARRAPAGPGVPVDKAPAGAAPPNIRDEIVARRRARIAAEGHALGADVSAAVPTARTAPLVRFLRAPRLICEIKRKSPSRGAIDAALDPVELAGRYVNRGVRSVSILTEEDSFGGSLADHEAVKRAHPDLAVLRKDFLVDEEDVEVSYRAGADAVLLIASVLSADELGRMHELAGELGMAALVELHEDDDFEKARAIAPPLVGINARDLSTFRVDPLAPVRLRAKIDWDHRAVYESGVFTQEDALLVSSSGFDGLLVGEAAVRDQDAIRGILAGLRGRAPAGASVPGGGGGACPPGAARRGTNSPGASGTPAPDFWARLTARMRPDRPLVKVCGITNRHDAGLAVELGADALGFVFADSPRRADAGLVRDLADLPVLKVAVVVTGGAHGPLAPEVRALVEEGAIDAVQFHGDEEPHECGAQAFPYYKALRLDRPEAADALERYRSPRVLVDARDARAYGGTGKRLSPETIAAVRERAPLWLAGGLSHENVRRVIADHAPELVDVSSGLEAAPGRKDEAKLRRFFEELSL